MVTSAIFFSAFVVLGIFAVWSRRGRSSAARWWVRRRPLAYNFDYERETLGLVAIPVVAELCLAIAVIALPGMPGAAVAAIVIIEVIGLAVILGLARYRRFLPLWMYPAWLREERAREKASLPR